MTQKYRNKKVVIDGRTFDSKAESRYYLRLVDMKAHGKIKIFECQPVMELFKDPERNAFVKFTPDFKVTRNDGMVEYVDVKSPATRRETSYILRRKLLKYMYPGINFIEA